MLLACCFFHSHLGPVQLQAAEEDVAAAAKLAGGPSASSVSTCCPAATAAAVSQRHQSFVQQHALQAAHDATARHVVSQSKAAAPAEATAHAAAGKAAAAAPVAGNADAASVVSLGAHSALLAESVYGGVKVGRQRLLVCMVLTHICRACR